MERWEDEEKRRGEENGPDIVGMNKEERMRWQNEERRMRRM